MTPPVRTGAYLSLTVVRAMRTEDFDYELPKELIAQEPLPDRADSRLLVLHRATGAVEHRRFRDLLDYLEPTDVLVLNETRVLPVRLRGRKEPTGAQVELLLLRPLADNGTWETLVRPGRRVGKGTRLSFGPRLAGEVLDRSGAGGRHVRFSWEGDFEEVLGSVGEVPLPPYIKRALPAEERDRYQTVYARTPGSAAAPTAGLHFTPDLLDQIRAAGVKTVPVVLHIGLDTFRPVQVEDITEHRMHSEYYEVTEQAAREIRRVRQAGGRIIAVGTTVTRCLESAADADGHVQAGAGRTELFIHPGYRFRAVDALLTNFHLPRSTLLMLVSAFAGRETVLAAYREAVRERYRLFSFGDAMLII